MRLFVAIELPDEVREVLGSIQAELGSRVRGVSWSKPASIHLTLKFLGEVDESRVDGIAEALKKAAEGIPSLTLSTSVLGAFPDFRHPRVIWVGIREDEWLLRLQERIEERLQEAGFEKEGRPFHPHLTLCRIKSLSEGRDLGKAALGLKFDKKMDFTAASFVLFKSVLSPKGAEYTVLRRLELKGA